MPSIPFGPHSLSRLILGANPINGGSHLSRFVNQQMKRYFTCFDPGGNSRLFP